MAGHLQVFTARSVSHIQNNHTISFAFQKYSSLSIPHVANLKCTTAKNFSTTHSQSKESYTEHLERLHGAGVRFGQPTQFTHPHLLKPNQLAIGILPSEFAERRQKFMEKIQEHCFQHHKPKHSIVSNFNFSNQISDFN